MTKPPDLSLSSFDFHRRLEPLSAFLSREKKAVALFAGAFAVLMAAAILLIDPAFFYPRIQTDPLNYLLKGKEFAETGSTAARSAINLDPFAYASFPGVFRAPLLAAFGEFDHQLRAIQIANIPIVAMVALLSAYILSWVLPQRRHAAAIGFAFAFTLLSPVWVSNVFLPLVDAPYAAATLGALIAAIELLTSDRRLAQRPLLIAVFVLLFVAAFLLRYTAPVLLLAAAVLMHSRWKEHGMRRQTRAWLVGGTLAGLAVLVAFNWGAINGRYLREPLGYLEQTPKTGVLANLFGAAVPSQIIPSFQLGFRHPPIQDLVVTSYSISPANIAWTAFGMTISAIVLIGVWKVRRALLPELLYLLGALIPITLLIPSTTRYLMTFQPFVWAFFCVGAGFLLHLLPPRIRRIVVSRVAIGGILVAGAAVAFGLRAWKVAGTASERYFAVNVTRTSDYVSDVSGTFRALRSFIDALPANALVVGGRGTSGRWKVISGRHHYYPDSALPAVARERPVYLLVECGTLEACQAFEVWKYREQERLRRFGRLDFESAFAQRSGRARVEALRVRAVD